MSIVTQDSSKTSYGSRLEVTDAIRKVMVIDGLTWKSLYEKLKPLINMDLSKEWIVSACLGQNSMPGVVAEMVTEILGLHITAIPWLMKAPIRAGYDISHDPLVCRLNEAINVYGETIKELVHEEFGDGIMSAIDFDLTIGKQIVNGVPRVSINMTGKYLEYKKF
uniref:Cyanate hydratase n=1 Tax=Rhabditophanes sp. KR3021 TaxID=114890 RepID=A0AC35TNI7_9BILA